MNNEDGKNTQDIFLVNNFSGKFLLQKHACWYKMFSGHGHLCSIVATGMISYSAMQSDNNTVWREQKPSINFTTTANANNLHDDYVFVCDSW